MAEAPEEVSSLQGWVPGRNAPNLVHPYLAPPLPRVQRDLCLIQTRPSPLRTIKGLLHVGAYRRGALEEEL